MKTRDGELVAEVLTGSWRSAPPPLSMKDVDLETVASPLLEGGAGSLAYHRLRCAGRPKSAALFRDAFLLHTLETKVSQQRLIDLLSALRLAGVEPLIVKGWSSSLLYPDASLRPYGDIDLCVGPRDHDVTADILTRLDGKCGPVDLHVGVADLDRPLEQLFARSRQVALKDTFVRVLGAEDQLRHLSLHFMRHGAWRPLWLCDIAAAMESAPHNFDWDYCLSGDTRFTEWLLSALGLAQCLLQADALIPNLTRMARPIPCWLKVCTLALWGQGGESNDTVAESFSTAFRGWHSFRAAMKCRWPNPIRAAYHLRLSPFRRHFRPLVQFGSFLLRAKNYFLRSQQEPSRSFDVHRQG